IHLDFHTSGEIPNVGAEFDADAFVETLRQARVNSITCFAKGHHGYSYYPTRVGVRHPHLTRDLLGEQVEACHRAGIRVPAYVSVVWDEHTAATHQEWLQVNREGQEVGRKPLETRGWRWLCMNTAYVDYVAAQTEEVLRDYPVDGVFFDIVKQTEPGCVCNACRARLAAHGKDPADADALRAQSLEIAREFMHRMTAMVHHIRPQSSVFYNSRLRLSADPHSGSRAELSQYTHVEIESLPTGGWGYNHYPLFSRYFQPLGKDLMGMTARFHKSWADFGGLKNRAALEYECFSMLATGAKCSIGDQLHPSGRLERPAYERIGEVYRSVETKEPWCRDAESIAEIGVILAHGQPGVAADLARDTDEGIMRMLLEGNRTFHFLDNQSELIDYRLVILPDSIPVGPALAVRLREYLGQGGKLLLTGTSGLEPTGNAFALKELGLRSLGPSKWTTAYVRVDEQSALASEIASMDHVVYEPGWTVEAEPGAERLASVVPPYFNRDHLHFMSHAQTPPAVAPGADLPPQSSPAVTRRGGVAYIAFPLCRAYRRSGNQVYRTLLLSAIDLLNPKHMVRAGIPSSGQVTLLRQSRAGGRLVAHLLYYVAERRTPQIDIIEDVVPLRDVPLSVETGFQPMRVYEAPSGQTLNFQWDGDMATVQLPLLQGHAMVVFEP
ncbi:MAG TPA: alpha-amylase family protein, partial [Chloroflexota bacterium]|nr:alpha-amylase family protein [Chloroflexota bacterium]